MTFKNQAKFWLDEHEIMEMYMKKLKNVEEDENDDDMNETLLKQREELSNKIVFMQGGCRAFTFSKHIGHGQYVLPFSFKLPENIPGTF